MYVIIAKLDPSNNYYIKDLNKYEYNSNLWSDQTGSYPNITNYMPIRCLSTNILGKFDINNIAYLNRMINIPTPFSSIDFSFEVYQFSVSNPILVQVYLDNIYIHGAYFSSFDPIDTIYCNSRFFYKKTVAFSYYLTNYFYMISSTSPLMKIMFYPGTQCVKNKNCGWGIANFTMNVTLPGGSSVACPYRPFSTNYCTANSVSIICIPGFFSIKNAISEYSCSPCPSNCLTCSSGTKCTICNPGFDFNSNLCVPTLLSPSNTQSVITRIELGVYNSNNPYMFTGFGLNFWVKMTDKLTIENPLIQLDTYLLNYNSNLTAINIRNNGNSSLYGQSILFPLIYGYNLSLTNKVNYEAQWTSISFSGRPIVNNTKFFLQIIISGEKSGQVEDSNYFVPSNIQLFSWFSKKFYRNIQYWDKYMNIESLLQFNYL